MKLDVRNLKARHVMGMLDSFPLMSPLVADGRVALEKATTALTTARVEELAKKEASGDASARVRDATEIAFEECRRGHGALVAKNSALGEKLGSGMQGHRPKAVLGRAEYLLELGTEAGVALPTLAVARDALSKATTDSAAAKKARSLAREARVDSEATWDAAYSALHGAIENALGAKGVKGKKLKQELQVYFPPRTSSKPVAQTPQGVPAGDAPKTAKPAP